MFVIDERLARYPLAAEDRLEQLSRVRPVLGQGSAKFSRLSGKEGAGPAEVPAVAPAGTLPFPQFDQCFPAIEGAGVAIGVLLHITQQLRESMLSCTDSA